MLRAKLFAASALATFSISATNTSESGSGSCGREKYDQSTPFSTTAIRAVGAIRSSLQRSLSLQTMWPKASRRICRSRLSSFRAVSTAYQRRNGEGTGLAVPQHGFRFDVVPVVRHLSRDTAGVRTHMNAVHVREIEGSAPDQFFNAFRHLWRSVIENGKRRGPVSPRIACPTPYAFGLGTDTISATKGSPARFGGSVPGMAKCA